MDTSHSFESLSDDDLHAAVRRLTARSNIALADLLTHLGEVETRGIHRTRACATLYTYCLYELRMSEDAAFRRSKAARIVHQHPDLRGVLARGELHLTGLLMIAPYLGGERHAEILERARFRSKREIARLIAELDPKPEVPARIEPIAPAEPPKARTFAEALAGPVRRLPVGDRPESWVESNPVLMADAGANGVRDSASEHIAKRELAEAERALESAWRARREAHPERPLRFKVQFTASPEYVELLEEAFDLLGFTKKASSLPELQLQALRELVERLRRRKTGMPRAARAAETSERTAPERHINAAPERDATPTRDVNVAPERAETAEGTAPERDVDAAAPDPATRELRPSHGRHIRAAVLRAVWRRDTCRCAYIDGRGRRCSETRGLQVHHREAYALGGPSTVDNLELRCMMHNALAAEQDFGRDYMDWIRGKERVMSVIRDP